MNLAGQGWWWPQGTGHQCDRQQNHQILGLLHPLQQTQFQNSKSNKRRREGFIKKDRLKQME